MKIIHSVEEMLRVAHTCRAGGKHCSFVPTMGALHEGHMSLLTLARERADLTVMSVFVNPAQFGPKEDFSRYPRPFDADCERAQRAGCDIMFAPAADEMYPLHFQTTVAVGDITTRLCGASRPGHFAGVTTVVCKLFNIVRPDSAVFGAKDAQQVIVIKRMVKDLHIPVEIIVGPIVREQDGLAMSSRNVHLTVEERAAAPIIHQGLEKARLLFDAGERRAAVFHDAIGSLYSGSPLILPEYIEIADPETLKPLTQTGSSALVAVACRMRDSQTRLIDNTVLGEPL